MLILICPDFFPFDSFDDEWQWMDWLSFCSLSVSSQASAFEFKSDYFSDSFLIDVWKGFLEEKLRSRNNQMQESNGKNHWFCSIVRALLLLVLDLKGCLREMIEKAKGGRSHRTSFKGHKFLSLSQESNKSSLVLFKLRYPSLMLCFSFFICPVSFFFWFFSRKQLSPCIFSS